MSLYQHIDPHIIQLIALFMSLVIWGMFPKATAYKWIILLLIISIAKELFIDHFTDEQSFLHFGKDLLCIATLLFLLNMIRNNYLKIAFLPFTIFSIFYAHHKWIVPIEDWQVESVLANDESIDKNAELIIELSTAKAIHKITDQLASSIQFSGPAFLMENPSTTDLDNFFVIDTKSETNVSNFITELSKFPEVLSVDLNQIIKTKPIQELKNEILKSKKTNDPLINNQWISDVYNIGGIHKKLTNAKSQNSDHALIAILDTGVDANHEDLKGNYLSLDKVYDRDVRGHGTHCAGIAAAVSNNKIGITSLIPDESFVKITSVKVLNNLGIGSQRTIINGMIKAVDQGADVISMSLGTFTTESKERSYTAAVEYATERNVIVIAAAGNSNTDATNFSPANTPGIITVGAIDHQLNKASFSNQVENVKMGIYAPGVKILSTLPNDQYNVNDGTSMAAPFVAGLAGLVKSLNPKISTQEFYELIKSTGKRINSLLIIDPEMAIEKTLSQ